MTIEELAEAATEALSVSVVRPLRDGGQKTVKLVSRANTELVMKVIRITSSAPAALKRAEREVELLEWLDHPGLLLREGDRLVNPGRR